MFVTVLKSTYKRCEKPLLKYADKFAQMTLCANNLAESNHPELDKEKFLNSNSWIFFWRNESWRNEFLAK